VDGWAGAGGVVGVAGVVGAGVVDGALVRAWAVRGSVAGSRPAGSAGVGSSVAVWASLVAGAVVVVVVVAGSGAAAVTGAGDGDAAGVYIFTPDGEQIGFIQTPEIPGNCTFSGHDLCTLYIAASSSLYRIRLGIPGLLTYPRLV